MSTVIFIFQHLYFLLDEKELSNGFTYKFNEALVGLNELISSIKTVSHCYGFFEFSVKVNGDGSAA